MGGINPPTNSSYSLESIRLSRSVSLARTSFEMSNVSFEDLLFNEITANTPGNLLKIVDYLKKSITYICEAIEIVDEHHSKMDLIDHHDLPEMSDDSIDWHGIGKTLFSEGVVDIQKWEDATDLPYYSVLQIFKTSLENLKEMTGLLLNIFSSLEEEGCKAKIHKVMEENQGKNPKVAYAQLYTAWFEFQSLMLASSLILSEASYQHYGNGSLLEKVTQPV